MQRTHRVLIRVEFDTHDQLAAVGEFGRVSEQIQKYLPETAWISNEPGGHGGINPAANGEAFGSGAYARNIKRLRDDDRQIEGNLFKLDLARFDFREVENVIHDLQKIVAGSAAHAHILPLFVAELCSLQQFRHSKKSVHWSADLVTHARKELALGLGARSSSRLNLAT